MTSSCSCDVSELRIFWFLRIVLLKVEHSKQASKSKEKRKQEWSYQQCNLVWYQNETIEIEWDLFLPSTKLMGVLEQAYSMKSLEDRTSTIVLARLFWQDLFGKVVLARSLWQDRYEKIVLARLFWDDRFDKIVLARSFWKDRSGKIVMARLFWQDLFGKIVVGKW